MIGSHDKMLGSDLGLRSWDPLYIVIIYVIISNSEINFKANSLKFGYQITKIFIS